MAALSSFYPFVLPFAPGCSSPVADRNIIDGAIEFCEATRVIVRTLDPISVTAGVGSYDLEGPDNQSRVSQISAAWYMDTPLIRVPEDAVDNPLALVSPIGSQSAQTGQPIYMLEPEPGVISLYPVPDATLANAITIRAVLRPVRAATELDDYLYEEYAEEIGWAALKRICATPGQPYSNPTLAAMYTGKLESAINKARSKVGAGVVGASLQVKLSGF